jgi:glycosyltransferase involved in cell wall biosynthesis
VHVAELNPVKDQATLLQALALLAQVLPAVRLDLVGGGPQLARLRRLARDLGVARCIQWWGQVPPGVVPLALGRADAFVLASRHEGQGMALAEAASAGLPIASTQVGMAPDLPAEGVRLAPPGDPVGLARAMAWALGVAADPDARRHVQGTLREAAVRDYDVRVCVGRWLALYARLIAPPWQRARR